MRIILIAIIALGAIHNAAAQSSSSLSNTGALLDRIVAVVNEDGETGWLRGGLVVTGAAGS